jgi:sialate O-acetylesterase
MRYFRIAPLFFLILGHHMTVADVSMPYVFSSNMVLQRNIEIPVWGWASPGERINITLGEQKIRTKAEESGKWFVKLPAMKAGGPYEMIVDGKNQIRFTNIMIGDVWVCSGQSNMEWRVLQSNNAEDEIASANHPNIRLFTVPNKIDKEPQNNTDPTEWLACTPEVIGSFSAVGYFFGRKLNKDLDIPIGLINTTWGGTESESWTSAESIQDDPDFAEELKKLKSLDMDKANEEREKEFENWLQAFRELDAGYDDGVYLWASSDYDYSGWDQMELPGLWEDLGLEGLDGVVWFAKEVDLSDQEIENGFELNLGPIDDSDIVWVNGSKVGETFNIYNRNRRYQVTSEVLKQGVNTIVVRVEDYAGGGGIYGDKNQMYLESNGSKISLAGMWKYKVGTNKMPSGMPRGDFGPNSYPTLLFNAMINPLLPYGIKGAIWYQGESNAGRAYQYRRIFPMMITDWRSHWGQGNFPFLFVQLANFMQPKDPPAESTWAELREAQTMTLSLPSTGMATIIDIGEADDIHPTNKQDVGKRLALSAYKIAYGKDIVYTGPTYESMKIEGNKVYIKLSNTGSGLDVRDPYGYLKGFTVAGKDKTFHWAKAQKVDDTTVVVYSEMVSAPVAVRYGWADNPHDLNLYNKEGLPANPFRTDEWQGITYGKK